MSQRLSDLPVGALVKDIGTTYNGSPIIWQVLEHGHTGDPEGTTTLASRDILLPKKSFDAKEPTNPNSDRKSCGNNRYLYSNLLQWLNSDAPANKWYIAQHIYDQAPNWTNVVTGSPYTSEAGFLSNFSVALKALIQSTEKKTIKNVKTDGGGYENVSSKIFLLSKKEVGLGNENNIAEGSTYTYYSSNTVNRRKKSNTEGSLDAWWLRTPYYDSSSIFWMVKSDGYSEYRYAFEDGNGIIPTFNIDSSLKVSDNTDSDGSYIFKINNNQYVKITPDEIDLGNRVSGFNVGYTITDIKQGQYSAIIKLDNTQVASISDVVLGQHYTYEVTTSVLNQLSTGKHKIIIILVSNDEYIEAAAEIAFNHVADELFLTGSNEDLGNVWHKSQLTYQVRGVEDKSVTVTESLDRTQVRSFEATLDTDIVFDDTNWKDMGDEASHTAVITATNEDDVTVTRTWTFTKLMDELCFYTKPKATLNPATKINVVVGYEKDGNPTLKVEVTNNALAGYPIWEDASAAVNAGKAYEFVNIPNNSAEYGVSVKVTIMKSAETERVYAHYVGYSYA